MKRATRSLLEELNSVTLKKDSEAIVESRAAHVINSAINLLTTIKENFPAVLSIAVTVHKPSAPVQESVTDISVTICR